MKILKTPIKGLLVVKNKKFDDARGYFREVLLEKIIKRKFKFNVVSMSRKNVIRGLHFQKKKAQAKFISVIKGKIIDETKNTFVLESGKVLPKRECVFEFDIGSKANGPSGKKSCFAVLLFVIL